MPDRAGGDDEAGGRLVLLGRIAGPHGVRGEVRLTSFTAAPEDIATYGPLIDGKGRRISIEALRPLKGVTFAARIAGVADRTAAEALAGAELHVERARLPEPDEDEWYHADLIGLAAFRMDGGKLGEVIAVQNFGAGDLLEIRRIDGGGTLLVPFTKAAAPVVDVKNGRIVVDEPEDKSDD